MSLERIVVVDFTVHRTHRKAYRQPAKSEKKKMQYLSQSAGSAVAPSSFTLVQIAEGLVCL
ncbi:hypothetical protein NQZ68_007726 [Dissostichus eleginoides]|nr:hypothetical protein NQZ68_007726 [Dissostichus eleginoides]